MATLAPGASGWWSSFAGGFAAGALVVGALVGVVAWVIARRVLRAREDAARRAEGRARSAERMAEIGAMTSGLAHEIKNPLSTIGLNVQLASEAIADSSLPDEDKAMLVRRVETVERESTRLANILNDFLRFAGRIKLAPVEADLREVAEELVDFYRPQCDQHKVVLRADLPAAPVRARVDPALVKQALLNLLINATQVMAAQDSASRELMLRLVPADNLASKGNRPTAPREIAIHVIDTGPGIAPEKHAEIFRPYVTGRKGGSGLGLAVTRRIVEEHGGRIELFSEPGKGSDFVILLPVDGPADSSRAADDDDARKTVLDRLVTRAERQS